MGEWRRTLAALADNQGLVPSPYMATYILFVTAILGDLDPSSRLHRHQVHNAFTYTQAKYTHEIKISKSFF